MFLIDLIGRPVVAIRLIYGWKYYNQPFSSKIDGMIVINIHLEIRQKWGLTYIIAKLYTATGLIFSIVTDSISNFSFKNIYTADLYCKSLNLPYTINYG